MTRRGLMTGTALAAGGIATVAFALPALGFALGPVFEDSLPTRWQDVGPEDDFNDETYVPRVINIVPRDRRGRQDHDLRPHVQPRARQGDRGQDPQPYVAISTRCAHLGCPVRYIQASASSSALPRRGLRVRGPGRGGPPVRPLDRFYTRVSPAAWRWATASR